MDDVGILLAGVATHPVVVADVVGVEFAGPCLESAHLVLNH